MRWIVLLVCVALSSTASAQTGPTHPWSRGTTLEGFIGMATHPTTTGSYGGAVGWELTQRFEIQGLGAWFPHTGTDEFAADLKVLMNLIRPTTLVPYVTGGAGLYQGTFDRAKSETDPTAIVGGGAHLYLRRHFSIRPEAAARFVIDRTRVYRVATVTFALTYHFEEHGPN
ncbi:MAG TPA: hypothetical protein VFO48_04225 [Vicinamibacterales bacterium]|nr:hypothetical protein [Vicinamibacterales bacterium]